MMEFEHEAALMGEHVVVGCSVADSEFVGSRIGHEQCAGRTPVELELEVGLSKVELVAEAGIENVAEVELVIGTVVASAPAVEPENMPEVGAALHAQLKAAADAVQLIADKDNTAGNHVANDHIHHTADSIADTIAQVLEQQLGPASLHSFADSHLVQAAQGQAQFENYVLAKMVLQTEQQLDSGLH